MVLTQTVVLADSQATYHLGAYFGKVLSPGSILLLQGDLGAGKTTFVQGVGSGLEIPEQIDSPTFTLITEYHSGRIPLYHLDLYRLESSEITALNIELYWEGIEVPPGITAIEWAERLPDQPTDCIQISLQYQTDGSRLAEISYPPSLSVILPEMF